MAAVAAVFAFGSRSETLRGLGGPGRDERWAMIDLRASALAGLVVIMVLFGALLVEVAQGRDGSPYVQVMGVGGVAYLAAVLILRHRSERAERARSGPPAAASATMAAMTARHGSTAATGVPRPERSR